MHLSYILAAATALVSFAPSISATSDSETGRGIRQNRSYRRYDGKNGYGRDNDYGYGSGSGNEYENDYGYGGENNYYSKNRKYGHGGYYRYRRNEDSIKQVDAAETIEQAKQAAVAEQVDGHRHKRYNRYHDRRSGHRYYGGNDYDYDYGYGRRSHHRRSNYYY